MAQTCEGPPRGGSADGPEVVCFGGERFPDNATAQKYQAQNLVRRLRLVPRPPPPRPRRLEVRISVADGRSPIGKTRPLRLREADLAWLVEAAERMEARATLLGAALDKLAEAP